MELPYTCWARDTFLRLDVEGPCGAGEGECCRGIASTVVTRCAGVAAAARRGLGATTCEYEGPCEERASQEVKEPCMPMVDHA